jgi:hypothetical protein
MSHPETLGFYKELMVFSNNHQLGEGAKLQFPAALNSSQRMIVRFLAHQFNLKHPTYKSGPEEFIEVKKFLHHPFPQQ